MNTFDWNSAEIKTWWVHPEYVYIADKHGQLIHADGSVSSSLTDKHNSLSGVFWYEQSAKTFIDKTRPPVTLGALAPGQKFKFVDRDTDTVYIIPKYVAPALQMSTGRVVVVSEKGVDWHYESMTVKLVN